MTELHELRIQAVKSWLVNMVIGLNLCPFAKKEFTKDRIRYTVTDSKADEELLSVLNFELEYIFSNSDVETTLLILSDHLKDFYSFNQFLDMADALIERMDFEGVFQIASFHPDYQFDGTEPDDVENYTNRSPFPILHILREESLEKAIANYPDAEKIPERNIALLESMGIEKILPLFRNE